jgi:Ca2+-binding RTX toxin-like protein
VTNVENGFLTGSAGADDLTISGAQLDALIFGSGTIDFAANTDTLNLTSTSADLNSLGATDGSVVGVEIIDASTAAADTTVNLVGQTENLTITGSANNDTLTSGTGDDSIYGRDGDDIITAGDGNDNTYGGDGNDTINGGAGDDTIIGDGTFIDTSGIISYDPSQDTPGGVTTQLGNGVNMQFNNWDRILVNYTITANTILEFDIRVNTEGDIHAIGFDNDTNQSNSTGQQFQIFGTQAYGGSQQAYRTYSGSGDYEHYSIPVGTFYTGVFSHLTLANDDDIAPIDSNADWINIMIYESDGAGAAGGDDILTGGAGVDNIVAGAGNDTINLANGDFGVGENIAGGAGTDEIVLTNATTVDFTTGTISGVETLTGSTGADDVTYSIDQALDFTTIDLGGGTDNSRVQVNGTVDVTALGTPTILNAENGFLTGSAGADTLTISGAQLDALVYGAGIIDFGNGADTLNLTSTSSAINSFVDGDIVGLETINASTAAASVTINLSGHTEDFTIIGSNQDDFLITEDGDDVINGGAGNDEIVARDGVDTVNGGAGDDTFVYFGNFEFDIGESVDGGIGTDQITLWDGSGYSADIDFTRGTIASVENLLGTFYDDNVTIGVTQFYNFDDIDYDGGTDDQTINVSGIHDVTALTAPTVTSLENGSLSGSAGADELTITGAQLDSLVFGSGTINMGGNSDTLNLTSESTNLNTLGLTDGSIAGLETIDASTLASDLTINLSGQTEAFTVNGGDVDANSDDTIITGSGNDTINGGTGDDILDGGAGSDIINGGNRNDTLLGGAGADTLDGGSGNDFLYGNSLTQTQINTILTANPSVVYNAGTNSFYEFVASGLGWSASQTAASGLVLNGLNGHLATVTSLAEVLFLDSQVNPTNNTSIGSYFTSGDNSGATTWRFTDGIEEGLVFWEGTAGGSTVNNFDNMWVTGQPNGTGIQYNYLLSYSDGMADTPDAGFAHSEGYIAEWSAGLMSDDNAADIMNGGFGDDHIYGYGGDDTLNGDDGNDIIFGGAGNDTISGGNDTDTLVGGAGNDTIYGDGTEAATLTSTQGWNFQYYNLPFTATPDLNGAGFTLNGARDHYLGSTTAGVASDFTPATYDTGDDYALKFETTLTITTGGTYTFRTSSDDGSMLFLDGVQIVDNDGLHGVATVTSAGQALSAGTYTLELTFFERGGGNVLNAEINGPDTGSSWTDLDTYAGANVVTKSASVAGSDDLIVGGAGTDELYGGGGADTFVFEAASAFAQTDTIMDFSTTDGDILDISDIITGAFSGNIKEYLQFTSDGATGDTLVQVDADGTASGTNFQTIARLDGIVGLDEVTLYNAGDIIV